MKDLFIDIEALGHVPGCAVIQIGAIVFDRHTGETAEEIQIYIQPEKSDRFHADLDTLDWHAGKGTYPHPPDIREIAFSVADAVDCLNEFFIRVTDAGHEIETFWSWGSDYDFPLIEPLFELYAIGGEPPWEYWQISDARTVWNLAFPGIKHSPRPHNALEDCRHGIKDLCTALAELTGGRDIAARLVTWAIKDREQSDHLAAARIARELDAIIDDARTLTGADSWQLVDKEETQEVPA